MTDYHALLQCTFRLSLPRLKTAKYTHVVASDILNIMMVKHGGRRFALLSNNSINPEICKERSHLYSELLAELQLNFRMHKKNFLIWNPKNRYAQKHCMENNIGQLLGYFDPLPEGWEEYAPLENRLVVSFNEEKTGLHIFGQNVSRLVLTSTQSKFKKYLDRTMRKINRCLKNFNLIAVYDIASTH